MSYAAILLDCDGTIFPNVEMAHEACALKALENELNANGYDLNLPLLEQVWFDTLGAGIRNFYEAYANKHLEVYDEDIREGGITPDTLMGIYEQNYIDLVNRVREFGPATGQEAAFFQVREGLEEMIKDAISRGITVSVVSNATQKILETTLSFIDTSKMSLILGSDTVENAGYEIKPSHGPYTMACGILGIDPQTAIGFEDTASGLLALDSANIGTIVFCKNCDDPKVDHVLATNDIKVVDTVLPNDSLEYEIAVLSGEKHDIEQQRQSPPVKNNKPA